MSKDPHAKRYELQRLVERSLEIARRTLAQQESFLPGFIAVQANGKYDLGVAAHGGAEGSNLLVTALRRKAAVEHLRAAALYRDVRVRPKGASEDVDAIQVVAELASGAAVHLFQVYGRNAAGQVVLGESETVPAPAVIFGGASGSAESARR
jgi:hypothetical protein